MNGLTQNNSLVLKGLAIIMIIASHVVGRYSIRYFTPLGGIGVAIFLFLSGYGLSESVMKKGFEGFWFKRILTVFLPYMFIELVIAMFSNTLRVKGFLLCILLIRPRQSQIWFLQFLLLCYVCFWCVYRFIDEKYRLTILFAWAIVLLFLLPEIAAEQVLSFWCGCAFSKRKEMFKKLARYVIVFGMIGCLALVVKQFDVIRCAPQIIMNLVQLMVKLPSGLFVIGFVIRTAGRFKYRYLSCAGKISYELYLVHINFLFLVTKEVLGVILFIVLTCCLSVAVHIVVSKVERVLVNSCIVTENES